MWTTGEHGKEATDLQALPCGPQENMGMKLLIPTLSHVDHSVGMRYTAPCCTGEPKDEGSGRPCPC